LRVGTRPDSLLPGETLPLTSLVIAGEQYTIGMPSRKAKQLVLFERGHWCVSCRRHLALIADSAGEFAARGIEILAITHEDEVDLLGRDHRFPVHADSNLDLAEQYGLDGTDEFDKRTIRPAAILVDQDGTIRFSYVGDDSRDRPTIPALLLAIDNLV
jgi:peroxiredoxin